MSNGRRGRFSIAVRIAGRQSGDMRGRQRHVRHDVGRQRRIGSHRREDSIIESPTAFPSMDSGTVVAIVSVPKLMAFSIRDGCR
jgi:hypothetical protein